MDIVSTISIEQREQSRWNFTSP